MSIKTGSKPWSFAGNCDYRIVSMGRCAVMSLDAVGNPHKLIVTGDGEMRFFVAEDFEGQVVVPDGDHWSIDVVPRRSPFDAADPTPIELPEDVKLPESLEVKLKRFVGAMLMERYGRGSREVETMEEALDFDLDEDGEIFSGFEVQEMSPQEPVASEELPEGEAPPETPPETPPAV